MRRREFLEAALATTVIAPMSGYAVAQTGGSKLCAIDAIRLDGSHTTIPGAALQELRDGLHGRMLLPQDNGYEEARRIAASRFDRRPALIVQAAGAADVGTAVDFARDNRLLLSVKGGGHSDCGVSAVEGGMMIDVSPMRGVRVDAEAKRAWVSGGTLSGLIDHETHSQGFVVPLGDHNTVGIGGLATSGGFGRVSRRFGLTLDAIRSFDIVTAGGKLVHASDAENTDLFWAVRGGGGNFGVVTDFEFELYPMQSRVVAGSMIFPFAQAKQILSAYSDFTAAAPDELYVDCFIDVVDTAESSTLLLRVCYSGDERDAEQVLAPLQRFGKVLSNTVAGEDYLVSQESDRQPHPRIVANTGTSPRDYYYRAGFAIGIDKGLVDAISLGAEPRPGRKTGLLFQPAGGAIARVANTATAFNHRSVSHDTIIPTSWVVDANADQNRRYAEQFWNGVKKHLDGFYNNDMAGAVTPQEVAVNFGENCARLARIKNRYDPDNLFRLNANVEPRAS